ncbi:hypothetical protein K2Z83_20715 [Oscillochloris sp. ZM17-4]|uniref:hypothetical protein n=1 Tax=Oscillochloris sp. ZM17-4 TaxID=2866714 RepID=UPI001C735BF0|nr:hypothetical protein [Oscillochloris sp. ZM17-4]MBX0330094.1 hypothetical protein [Oscillochloris sp. ZM17-4]
MKPTLFACHGYTDSPTPATINLYRDRAATELVATVPTTDPAAPARRDETYVRNGTTYRLVWID